MTELESQHPLYPFTEEDKLEVRKELGLKDTTIQKDIDAILEWFSKQAHLVEAGIEPAMIERMLIMSKGSLEKTKQRIDNLYKYRALAPELIQNRERELADSKDIWGAYCQIAMPKIYNGKRITIIKFMDPDPSKLSCEAICRNSFMLGDIRFKYDYSLGDIWIIDMNLTTIGHLLRMNPMVLQRAAHIFHEGLRIRIFALHILNANGYLQHLVTCMKQFFNPKILDRIITHQSYEDLHKYIPKKYLPKDYDGDELTMNEFKDKYEKELRSTKTRQFLIDACKMVSDESKIMGAEVDADYLAGSFRKLDFD